MNDLLSVIITSYKRPADIVLRAVKSVQNQTYGQIEILIVDDNPDGNDYSKSLQEVFHNTMNNVIYLKQDGNKGACAARNLGIKKAHGVFIGFLDDDDTWEPRKAELQLKKFADANDEKVGMVYCLGTVVDTTKEPPVKSEYYTTKLFKEEVTFADLLKRDSIGSTSQAVIKKSCFATAGGFNENLPARQDYEMWIRISKYYRILGVNEALFNYYQHDLVQITKSPKKALTGYRILYQLYKEDYNRDIEAKRNILERMMETCRGYHAFLFWYYRIYKYILKIFDK